MGKRTSNRVADTVGTALGVLAVMWLIELAQVVFRFSLHSYGILPRTLSGLPGILFSPFLHSGFRHLAANSLPLFVMLVLLLPNREYKPYPSLAWIWLGSGLGTWLIGRGHAVHIGASSVIFGLAAFLIVAGFQVRSWRSVAVAVFVLLLYGGIFYGVLPQSGPVSWEGHLAGAVTGAILAGQTLKTARRFWKVKSPG